MNKIIIEGLDRLGKSTLINKIQHELGYYQVLHFGKPQKLRFYNDLFEYQRASFNNLFSILKNTDSKIICDRSHIGEAVYSDLYRGYPGDYVFDLERKASLQSYRIKLILLTQDFSVSKPAIVDDNESLGPWENRKKEQELFLKAFSRSIISDKRIINVTNPDGSYKDIKEIFTEAFI